MDVQFLCASTLTPPVELKVFRHSQTVTTTAEIDPEHGASVGSPITLEDGREKSLLAAPNNLDEMIPDIEAGKLTCPFFHMA